MKLFERVLVKTSNVQFVGVRLWRWVFIRFPLQNVGLLIGWKRVRNFDGVSVSPLPKPETEGDNA